MRWKRMGCESKKGSREGRAAQDKQVTGGLLCSDQQLLSICRRDLVSSIKVSANQRGDADVWDGDGVDKKEEPKWMKLSSCQGAGTRTGLSGVWRLGDGRGGGLEKDWRR